MNDHLKSSVWYPFTQMKLADMPIKILHAKGTKLFTEDGKEIIDCISSWWVNIHGHCHPHISNAISDQVNQLEQVIFSGFTHSPAENLAKRLLPILPGKPEHAFFSDDGSTAVEVALKMALQYFHNTGEKRTKILAFENAYHGDTFGAMSVSAKSAFTNSFEELLFDVDFIPVPTTENREEVLKKLEQLLQKNKYAAFIFEPLIQGSAGMIMYEAEFLEPILLRCKKDDIILIADEIFTGFGRTGKMFACNYLKNAEPDIVCISKGLTGGFLPMGITACKTFIYQAFLSDDRTKTFFHGHSYTANPLACAAANASLDLFTNETFEKINQINSFHLQFKSEIDSFVQVKNCRITGTVLAIELKTKDHTSYFNSERDAIYNYFIKKGLLMRPLGNVIYLVPPYCITEEELNFVYAEIKNFLINR